MDSLLAQTYRGFQMLAIDDGSTDDSLAYLRSIRDHRLTVITQRNQGLSETLNRMLREVRSPWLVRMDADDVALPERLMHTADWVTAHPNAGMFYSRAYYYPKGTAVGVFLGTEGSPEQIRSITKKGYLLSVCHPTVTLNVEKTLSLGGYRFNLHVEDADLWWRMALEYEIIFKPVTTLGFRQNDSSVSSKNLELQALNSLYIQYLLLSHLYDLEPLPYASVVKTISLLLNRRQIRFKRYTRAFNIASAKRKHFSRIWNALAAAYTSPSGFYRRATQELAKSRESVRVGINPKEFRRFADRIWPASNAHGLPAMDDSPRIETM